VQEKYEALIAFIAPAKKLQEDIIDFLNCWDDSDVGIMGEVIDEGENLWQTLTNK
jgi:hypothetical protein